MSKRVHELAKEWAITPKDLLLAAEKLGIRGKRSQSSFTDEEVQRVRDILSPNARPEVTLGAERVVSERVVTARDNSTTGDAMVTAREQTTETRVRAGMIRRRTAREVLKREELPPTSFVPDSDGEIPPAFDLDEIAPPLPDAVPPSAAEPPVAAAPAASAEAAPAPAETTPASPPVIEAPREE